MVFDFFIVKLFLEKPSKNFGGFFVCIEFFIMFVIQVTFIYR